MINLFKTKTAQNLPIELGEQALVKINHPADVDGPSKQLTYIASLDCFRFFAVLLVIFSHWLGEGIINKFPNGFIGVTFFFVLSGFLISSNLLLTKKRIDRKLVTTTKALKTFYIRRTLRIFPLYYLVIGLVLLLVPTIMEGSFEWYAAYIPNFLIYKTAQWPGMLSHFWSLGVEEQFYLIWPFLVFLTPQHWLKYLFPCTILFSIAFKICFFSGAHTFFTFYDVLPFSCFDAFGVGAMLALITVDKSFAFVIDKIRVPNWIGFAVSVIISCCLYILGWSYLFGFFVSLASFFTIRKALSGYSGIIGMVVNNGILQYLGKISYGLYVYHNFIPWLVRCVNGSETKYPLPIQSIPMPWLNNGVKFFLLHFVVLVIIASLSWFLFENPINKMKKHFA